MKTRRPLALLYLGALTPDPATSRTSATSAAAEIFQRNFLSAIGRSSLPTPDVLTYVPVPSFPRHQLFVRGATDRVVDGPVCRTMGHVNFGPLKIVTLGLVSAWQTARWAIRNRDAASKVAIVYNLNAPPAAFLLPVCRLFGVRLVPFVGDIYVPGEVVKDGLFRRLEFWIQKNLVPRADGLLVCNRAIVEDFAPGRHALLIEGGVPDAFLDRFAHRTRTNGRPFHIVFAGGLTELNGVTVLLETLAQNPDLKVRVSIAGGGPYLKLVQAAAENDPRIEALGLVPHADVMALYQEADLLLSLRQMGSRTERYVFPSKVVECLGTGRPLLSTATGHVGSDFADLVFLLNQLNPESLGTKLREIVAMDPEEREAVGRQAQAYVRQNRTWEGHAERIHDYLREENLTEVAA